MPWPGTLMLITQTIGIEGVVGVTLAAGEAHISPFLWQKNGALQPNVGGVKMALMKGNLSSAEGDRSEITPK